MWKSERLDPQQRARRLSTMTKVMLILRFSTKDKTLRWQICIRLQMSEFEKFPVAELNALREELRQSGLDSFQAAELLLAFLGARGYGVSSQEARDAATRIETLGCSLPMLQQELERLAWVM